MVRSTRVWLVAFITVAVGNIMLWQAALADQNYNSSSYQGIGFAGQTGGSNPTNWYSLSTRWNGGTATWLYSSFKRSSTGQWHPQSTFSVLGTYFLYDSPYDDTIAGYGEHWISNGVGNYSHHISTFLS